MQAARTGQLRPLRPWEVPRSAARAPHSQSSDRTLLLLLGRASGHPLSPEPVLTAFAKDPSAGPRADRRAALSEFDVGDCSIEWPTGLVDSADPSAGHGWTLACSADRADLPDVSGDLAKVRDQTAGRYGTDSGDGPVDQTTPLRVSRLGRTDSPERRPEGSPRCPPVPLWSQSHRRMRATDAY